MLSEGGHNEVFTTRSESDDAHASVFGALDPADQSFRKEALDSDTDRAWGQIDDWGYRIAAVYLFFDKLQQSVRYNGEVISASIERTARRSLPFSVLAPMVIGPRPSESDIGQRSLRFHIGRDADFPPPLRFLRPTDLGLASVLNGIAAEEKMRRQVFAVNQTQDELSHLGGIAHFVAPVGR
jgi:hypothetical protein